jgi:membrane protease YdiL (CAAX protease family)
MKITEQNLREQYESLATEELIKLYTKNELTELASSILVQVLKERGMSLESLAKLAANEAKEAESSQEEVSPSFLDLIDYIKQYESLNTEELIELCKNSELNEAALSALTQILEERGISQETLTELVFEEKEKKAAVSVNNKFVFTYKKSTTPSLKAVILTPLIYLFGPVVILVVIGFTIGFFGVAIGVLEAKLEPFVEAISPLVSFFFYLLMTIFLIKRYSGYFFPSSWKNNIYSHSWVGLKWSILFIVIGGIAALSPEVRAEWLKYYLLVEELSPENITVRVLILISASVLVATFLEELIFRGMIQQHIKKFVTPRKSVLITAGIFTLAHFGHFFSIPLSFVDIGHWFLTGIFTGFAFNKYNSCISSFIPHLVLNLKHIIIVPLMLTF